MTTDTATIINNIVTTITTTVQTRVITLGNIVSLLVDAMELVEVYAIPGGTKKTIVSSVIDVLMKEMSINKDDEQALDTFVSIVMPSVIDAIVSAASGTYNINKKTLCSNKCCNIL